MKKLLAVVALTFLASCTTKKDRKIIKVASFTGQQVTGVTVSENGRIFANFPRWRKGVTNALVSIEKKGQAKPYPNSQWNSWKIGNSINDSLFIAVQSVVAAKDKLYVIDTRNPEFKGVINNPRIFVFDLETNQLTKTYILPEDTYHKNSYINDIRIDLKNGTAYMTDSGHAGLLILDLNSGNFKRVLNDHYSTLAEVDHLNFNGTPWNNTVHSDGIALDPKRELLYYHALTGYNLYAIPTNTLINGTEEQIQASVQLIKKTPAPDGMIFDSNNNLYLADLEKNGIVQLNVSTGEMNVFVQGNKVKWADTFSIYDNELYYTNSRINEITGPINNMVFTINKIQLD